MFTARHYEAIAQVIQDVKQAHVKTYDCTPDATFDELVRCLANMFQDDNPNFNRARFMGKAHFLGIPMSLKASKIV